MASRINKNVTRMLPESTRRGPQGPRPLEIESNSVIQAQVISRNQQNQHRNQQWQHPAAIRHWGVARGLWVAAHRRYSVSVIPDHRPLRPPLHPPQMPPPSLSASLVAASTAAGRQSKNWDLSLFLRGRRAVLRTEIFLYFSEARGPKDWDLSLFLRGQTALGLSLSLFLRGPEACPAGKTRQGGGFWAGKPGGRREEYPVHIPFGGTTGGIPALSRGPLPYPGYTPPSPLYPGRPVLWVHRAAYRENEALGSRAYIALGHEYFLANSRWYVCGAPIRQDYGEMRCEETAKDWIQPKGISNQATWAVCWVLSLMEIRTPSWWHRSLPARHRPGAGHARTARSTRP